MNYGNPTIQTVLIAVPLLQWRRCFDCKHIDLYRDNMLPVCRCRNCQSADTRLMKDETKLLHIDRERN